MEKLKMLSLDEILKHNNFRYTDEVDSLFEQQQHQQQKTNEDNENDIEMKKVLDENDYVEVADIFKNDYKKNI